MHQKVWTSARSDVHTSDVHTFWCIKKLEFFKFIVCPQGQGGGGLSQCGHFANKEVNFLQFCT